MRQLAAVILSDLVQRQPVGQRTQLRKLHKLRGKL